MEKSDKVKSDTWFKVSSDGERVTREAAAPDSYQNVTDPQCCFEGQGILQGFI
jgi:hypothetical protein